MTAQPGFGAERERVLFLARVVEREAAYLGETDRRLFAVPMTRERASITAAAAAMRAEIARRSAPG